jgi:hypothetical protein
MDLARRHVLVLDDPAGTVIDARHDGFAVRAFGARGSSMVMVPNVEALLELAEEECWSDADLSAIRNRWGRTQTRTESAPRYTFGPARGDDTRARGLERQAGG